EVRLVLLRGVRLDELDLDPSLALPDVLDRAGRALRELVLELRPGEVQHLDDERVRRGPGLPQRLRGENGPALLRVRRVLVALGALEAARSADVACGEAVRGQRPIA